MAELLIAGALGLGALAFVETDLYQPLFRPRAFFWRSFSGCMSFT